MTKNSARKKAVRARQAATGEAYTAARRRLADSDPPRLVPIAWEICLEGCDGSGHPGAVCHLWTPWEVRKAAHLPMGRPEYLRDRYAPGHFFPLFLLGLAYELVAAEDPGLIPARAAVRAAVESGDLAAVDALMEPLDRAAARLIPFDAGSWWSTVQPRLDAFARDLEARLAAGPPYAPYGPINPYAPTLMVKQWRTAFTPARNPNGYMETPGAAWLLCKTALDNALAGPPLGFVRPGEK